MVVCEEVSFVSVVVAVVERVSMSQHSYELVEEVDDWYSGQSYSTGREQMVEVAAKAVTLVQYLS